MDGLAIPESYGVSSTGKARVAEVDDIRKQLPQEPNVQTWHLLESRPMPEGRRRLDATSLKWLGFARGPLQHPAERPPTTAEMRADPAWEQLNRKRKKPPRSARECEDAALWDALGCLHHDKGRSECLQALKRRALDCPRLGRVVASELLSPRCAGERAGGCGPLLAVFHMFAERDEQRVLTAFLRSTSASNLPPVAITVIIAQRRAGAAFLTALADAVQRAAEDMRSFNASKGGALDWALLRILQPAAGAVKHARHGFLAPVDVRVPPLTGKRAAAAARITAMLADELHKALQDDTLFDAHHEAAAIEASRFWDDSLHMHDRMDAVAEQAKVASHEGLRWEIVSGRLGEHEAASRAALKRELLFRRPHYDNLAEEEHTLRLAVLLDAAGNLGLAPERDGHGHLLDNVTRCQAHRTPLIARKAAFALRHHPHPKAESMLLTAMERPPTTEHRDTRSAAVDAIAQWSNVSSGVVDFALRELLRTPRREVRQCLRACRAKRNPHLYHYGDHRVECKQSCQHEMKHAHALVKLVQHAAHKGHDLHALVKPMVTDVVAAAVDGALHAAAVRGLGNATAIAEARRRLGVGATANRMAKLSSAGDKAGSALCKMGGGSCRELGLGMAANAICYIAHLVPVIKQLCTGVELTLGFSPITKGKSFDLLDIPIVGLVGFGVYLDLGANLWARLGIFDGGFGVDIGIEAKAEFYFGPVRLSLLHAQAKFKFDFTYCTVCSATIFLYALDDAIAFVTDLTNGRTDINMLFTCFGHPEGFATCSQRKFDEQGGRRLSGRRRSSSGTAAPQPARGVGVSVGGPRVISRGQSSSSGSGQGSSDVETEEVIPVAKPPDLSELLDEFMQNIAALKLPEKLSESMSTAPTVGALPTALTKFVQENALLAQSVREVLTTAAASHHPFLFVTAPHVASASEAIDAAASPSAVQAMLDAGSGAVGVIDSLERFTAGLRDESIHSVGPLRRMLNLITQALPLVANLAARLDGIASGLSGTASLANWLHGLADRDQPTAMCPAPQREASAVRDISIRLGSALDAVRAAVEDGTSGVGALHAPDACPVNGSAVVRAALQLHGGDYYSLCCSVRVSLSEAAVALGAISFGKLRHVLEAINRREWAVAADRFARQGTFCTDDRARCQRLAAALGAGCPEPSHWAVPPAFARTLNVSNARVVTYNTSRSSASATDLLLAFDVRVTAIGTMRCEGQNLPLKLTFGQHDVRMMVTAPTAAVSDELIETLSPLMQLDSEGGVRLAAWSAADANASVASRWWSFHEQLVARSELLRAARLEADHTVCSDPARPADVAGSALLEALDGQLLVSARANASSALGALFVAQRLSGQLTAPVMLETDRLCSAECARGTLSSVSADEQPQCVTAVACADSPSSCSALTAVGLPEHFGDCVSYHRRDYATCGLRKADADARLVTCLRSDWDAASPSPCAAPPSDTGAFREWWVGCLSQLSLTSTAEQQPLLRDLVAGLDCATFAEEQRARCWCDMATFAPSPRPALSSAGAGCLTAAVGSDADTRAENRAADVAVVRARLATLGFLTAPGVQAEHSTRVFLCAAAGVVSMERVCDAVAPGADVTCTVEAVVCPEARRVHERGTCLLDESCAIGRIERGSSEHLWLQARNAPAWAPLPASGCGFEVHGRSAEERMRAWATTWAVEALIHAGRTYRNSTDALPLRVLGASLRAGGPVLGTTAFQTGLEIEVMRPTVGSLASDATLAQKQTSALRRAGFEIVTEACAADSHRAAGEQAICYRARLRPPDVMAAVPEDPSCSVAVTELPPTSVPVTVLDEPATALQVQARALLSTTVALNAAWNPRNTGDRAAAVTSLLPQVAGLGRAFQSRGPTALQLAAAVHNLHPHLVSLSDPDVESSDGHTCTRARKLSASVPVDGSPHIPEESLRAALDHVAGADDFGAFLDANAAINPGEIVRHAQSILEALRSFAPKQYLRPMALLGAAKAGGLLEMKPLPTNLRVVDNFVRSRRVVMDTFAGNASQTRRASRYQSAEQIHAALQSWLSPKGDAHPLTRIKELGELDVTWEELWLNTTRNETRIDGFYQRAIKGFRVMVDVARKYVPLVLRAAHIGERVEPWAARMLEHVHSTFFHELASVAYGALHNVTMPALPEQEQLDAVLAELSEFMDFALDEANRLGGEERDIRSMLIQLESDLSVRAVATNTPLLQAFSKKLRQELHAAHRLNSAASRLAGLRRLASDAATVVCARSAPVATTAPSSKHVALGLLRATEGLFGPASGFGDTLAAMQPLMASSEELRSCIASRGCSNAQRDRLRAAERALGSYSAALEEARGLVRGGASAQPIIDAAAERAARLHRGADHLEAVGIWSRSLSQPGALEVQLGRAECRLGNASSCTALDASATTAEALRLVTLASGVTRWPLEVQKVMALLTTMRTELSEMRPTATAMLQRTRLLWQRFNLSASVARRMPGVAAALRTAKRASASALVYMTDVERACDRVVQHLDAGTFQPYGVWVTRDPSAFPHGPRSWEGVADSLAQLEAAHRAAARPSAICRRGKAWTRLKTLELELPAAITRAGDPGLFHSAVSGALIDVQVESSCLVVEILLYLNERMKMPTLPQLATVMAAPEQPPLDAPMAASVVDARPGSSLTKDISDALTARGMPGTRPAMPGLPGIALPGPELPGIGRRLDGASPTAAPTASPTASLTASPTAADDSGGGGEAGSGFADSVATGVVDAVSDAASDTADSASSAAEEWAARQKTAVEQSAMDFGNTLDGLFLMGLATGAGVRRDPDISDAAKDATDPCPGYWLNDDITDALAIAQKEGCATRVTDGAEIGICDANKTTRNYGRCFPDVEIPEVEFIDDPDADYPEDPDEPFPQIPNPAYVARNPERQTEFAKALRQQEYTGFPKRFLHFHFGTSPPLNVLAAGVMPHWNYDKVNFRFPVPLLDSKYALQSSTFYSVQWPKGFGPPAGWSVGLECHGCPSSDVKYCPLKCKCRPGCMGTCLPNGVGYLPERYIFAYKYGRMASCSNGVMYGVQSQHSPSSPPSPPPPSPSLPPDQNFPPPPPPRVPPRVREKPTCKPTILAMGNSKGVLVDTWRIMVPTSVDWTDDKVQDFCDHDTEAYHEYYGSLTGIAHTKDKQNGVVYGCGRPFEREDMKPRVWFLFRFRGPLVDDEGNARNTGPLADGAGKAYIDQVIPLQWLGPDQDDPDKGIVERCLLAHQPGWGGRGSANTGVNPKLWVVPGLMRGTDSWMATARACPLAPDSGCSGGPYADDETGRCADAKAGGGRSTAIGVLQEPGCFLSHLYDDAGRHRVVEDGWDLQLEGFKSNILHKAANLVVGSSVAGLSFFDNKLDESHVALARCKTSYRDHCWLEFHWFDPRFTLEKLIDALDIVEHVKKTTLGDMLFKKGAFESMDSYKQGPGVQSAIDTFTSTRDTSENSKFLRGFTLEMDMPITFLNPAAAEIERENRAGEIFVKNRYDYTLWYWPRIIFDVIPGIGPTLAKQLLGWGGKTMVRAMKVPSGLVSLAHDSSVGGRPHNHFHVQCLYARTHVLGPDPHASFGCAS